MLANFLNDVIPCNVNVTGINNAAKMGIPTDVENRNMLQDVSDDNRANQNRYQPEQLYLNTQHDSVSIPLLKSPDCSPKDSFAATTIIAVRMKKAND